MSSNLERTGPDPPLGVGIAPPGAGAGAGRVDQHEVDAAGEIGELVPHGFRRAHLRIVHARSLEPGVDRRQPALVEIGGVELAAVLHRRRERERLAAGAGAEIDHLLARLGAREQRGELRALVLHLDQALDEGALGVDGGILGIGRKRDAKPDRRPARGLRRKIGERGGGLVAVGLERIDAQIERSAARQRRAFGGALFAEHLGEIRVEPFRIVAGDPRRGICQIGGGEPRPLAFAQGRRRKTSAVGERPDRIGIELALEPQHAERDRARAPLAHDVRARGAPAQRVVDQPRDRRPVAGAGEAMREPPILERVARRAPPRLDIGDDLDGGGKAGARCHQMPSRMESMKIAHITTSTTAAAANTAARRVMRLLVTWI